MVSKNQKNAVQNTKKRNQMKEKVKKLVKSKLIETPMDEDVELPVANNQKGGSKKTAKPKKSIPEDHSESDESVEQEPEFEESDDEGPTEVKNVKEDSEADSDKEEATEVENEEEDSEAESDDEEETGEAVGYTLFVGNLAPETKRNEIIKLFTSYGKVLSVIFITPKGAVYHTLSRPRFRLKAFVILDSVEAVNKAVNVNGTLLNGQNVLVKICRLKKFVSDSTNTVFVRNVSSNTNSLELKEFFSSCGEVKYVKVVKGSAFVAFNSRESVKSAFELDGKIFNEQQIQVLKYEKKFIPTDKKALDNIDPEELKEKMIELGKKYTKLVSRKRNMGQHKSKSLRVKKGGITKGQKGGFKK